MFTTLTTQENSASVLIPEPRSQKPWRVARVDVTGDLTLQVSFLDGTSGKLRLDASFLHGVFEKLKDPALFKQAYVAHGAVTWPGELDLAPDAMYDAIKANGEWVLR